MADWRGVQAGLESGYQMGRASGGRLSVLGQSIAKLADNLRAQEVAGQQAQAGVLGEIRSARIKQMFDPEAQAKANIAAKIEAKQPLSPEENKLFYGYTDKTSEEKSSDIVNAAKMKIYRGEPLSEGEQRLLQATTLTVIPKESAFKPLGPPPEPPEPVGAMNPLRILPQFASYDKGIKTEATEELRRAGYPITENNIKSAMKQLLRQRQGK